MNYAKLLTRDELKKILAGNECRLYVTYTDGGQGGFWIEDNCYTYQQAQEMYGGSMGEGLEVTGYCCASCGQEPWENAPSTPCVA